MRDAPSRAAPTSSRGSLGGETKWNYALRFLPENEVVPLGEVRDLVLSERAQLWCGDGCAGVTEISEQRLHIMLAGGSMAGLLAMRGDVEAFGRAMGCRAVYLSGRKGWRRVFRKFGYAFDGEDMVRKIYESINQPVVGDDQ